MKYIKGRDFLWLIYYLKIKILYNLINLWIEIIEKGKHMKILNLVSKIIEKASEISLIIFMFSIVIVITLQVISRYVFNAPISWTMELNIFLFAWLIFIGASVDLKEDRHVKMEIFLKRFSIMQKKYISIFVSFPLIIFLIILIRNNILLYSLHCQYRTVTLRIPTSWFNLAFTVSCIFMLLHSLQKMVKDLYEIAKRGSIE